MSLGVSEANPADTIGWLTADEELRASGMLIPTEAQWEYACRGGTTGPWPVSRERLWEIANLRDHSWVVTDEIASEDWDDGFRLTSPAGAFHCNEFGLHDMLGNVREWCADLMGRYGCERPGDGLRSDIMPVSGDIFVVSRGGSYINTSKSARVSSRVATPIVLRDIDVGVRPARPLKWAD
jgi:formylglycine-generating enzyme required for sulfatase activity